MVMVRDLRAASESFARLGFNVIAGGRFPAGIENAIVPFGLHGSYLELVSVFRHGDPQVQDNEEFLAEGEGAMYLGLQVDSAADIAARLRGLGLEVAGPMPGTIKPEGVSEAPPVLWRSVVILHGSSPRGDPIFFTEYDAAGREALMRNNPEYARKREREQNAPHPNGSLRIAAAWLASRNLIETSRRCTSFGFPKTREFSLARLGCHGVEHRLDRGSLFLLESDSTEGPLPRLFELHKSDLEIPGLSIEVGNLGSAREAMSPEVRDRVESFDGPTGRGLLVPPDLAHGLWLELLERGGSRS